MIFTDIGPVCPEDDGRRNGCSGSRFYGKSGSDNRVLVDLSRAPKLRKQKCAEATRRNYDRLCAEGEAIL